MAYSGTYCKSDDLLVGDVTLKSADAMYEKHITGAQEEIDSRIGFVYTTPIDSNAVSRQGWLLIKRIAIFIASGRLLMETDQAGEEGKVHAYANYLLEQADAALVSIAKGDITLGLTPEPEAENRARNKVMVNNLDPFSMVEAFYGLGAQSSRHPTYGGNGGFWQ